MKLEIKDSKSSKIRFQVTAELSSADLNKQKEKVIKELGKNIKVSGFRAGKAPVSVLESKLDPNIVARELASASVDKAFAAMVDQFKLNLIGQPKIEITEFEKQLFTPKSLK